MIRNRYESKGLHFSMNHRGIIALVLLLMWTVVLSNHASSFSTCLQKRESLAIPSNQVFHESIAIASDNDFISQGWPGNGSISNPFLIEGLTISSDDECVRINNTRSYFIIRNCSFSWMLNQYHGTGVYLRNVTHGFIEMCTMSGLGVGIYDQQSTKNVYRDNTIEDTWDGILVDSCSNNLVSNNTIAGNLGGDDIWFLKSNECSVLGNVVSGIVFDWSTNCTAEHNYGLVKGLNIYSNNLTHWLHQIHDNHFNGKLLGYFRDTSDSIINGTLYSQLILVNATRIMISGGAFHNLLMGVQIIYSSDCTMSDIVSENNVGAGINIENSYNCTLVDSITNDNWIGVSISSSERIGVEGTQANYNLLNGIRISASSSCHFVENTISNNSEGVSIDLSNNCTLSENYIFGNEVGIVLSSSTNCSIIHNIVYKNGIGIVLSSTTSHTSIYWNSFIWNTDKNAVDGGSFNIWDDGISRGNIWSDYMGYGTYTIPGLAQSVDRFPMAVGYQIQNEMILVLLIIIITFVLLYSQKERLLRSKSSKT